MVSGLQMDSGIGVWEWGCNSVVVCLSSMLKALGSIPYTAKKKKMGAGKFYMLKHQ
jgi:hypothetical protein